MNIVDAVLIILFIVGIMGGIKRGFVKEIILLVGIILVIVLSFTLKNPIATFLYKYAPFIDFWGIFKGATVLNILFYEFIAFLIILLVLSLVLGILLKISGIVEKIFEITIVFGFVSKILGAIVGFITAYVLIFAMLFLLNQPFFNIKGIDNSRISTYMLNNTPFLGTPIKKTIKGIDEIKSLKGTLGENKNKDEFNQKSLDILLKQNIISIGNVKLLRDKNKLSFNGIDSLIRKYGG